MSILTTVGNLLLWCWMMLVKNLFCVQVIGTSLANTTDKNILLVEVVTRWCKKETERDGG